MYFLFLSGTKMLHLSLFAQLRCVNVFFCVVHRPDLIDWRSIQRRSARERLEHVFTVAERDCGVTRLLDAEGILVYNST